MAAIPFLCLLICKSGKKRVSLTAMGVAKVRYFYSLVGVFDDVYAAYFIPWFTRIGLKFYLPYWWLLRAYPDLGVGASYVYARAKMGEELVLDACANGVKNIVMLGAGFDCKFHILQKQIPSDVKLFEVDIDTTQQYKLNRLHYLLKNKGLSVNPNIKYVAVDFEEQDFIECLQDNDFDVDEPTLFLWEGVCMYLDEKSVKEVMNNIKANAGSESYLYMDILTAKKNKSNKVLQFLLSVLQKIKEPMKFTIPTDSKDTKGDALAEFFEESGFGVLEICHPADMEKDFLTTPSGKLTNHVFPFAHLVLLSTRRSS
eukprot:CAMPEP_0174252718 /NCGR_PEP_ID=MMETSP0439-20130205/2081_1 /TAXON_ID=0 /ORGANISM="Stereomyxa ramosa, Strain Chinc5" /LENGTH=313 /DNA_ID=CAMNT_0015333305 /DNA_START=156 /DNA_END=1097 /DNA_ORIENTATION=+